MFGVLRLPLVKAWADLRSSSKKQQSGVYVCVSSRAWGESHCISFHHHHSFSFRSLLFGFVNGFQNFQQHSAKFPPLCGWCICFKGTESAPPFPAVNQGDPITLGSLMPLVSLWKEAFGAATSITKLASET